MMFICVSTNFFESPCVTGQQIDNLQQEMTINESIQTLKHERVRFSRMARKDVVLKIAQEKSVGASTSTTVNIYCTPLLSCLSVRIL